MAKVVRPSSEKAWVERRSADVNGGKRLEKAFSASKHTAAKWGVLLKARHQGCLTPHYEAIRWGVAKATDTRGL